MLNRSGASYNPLILDDRLCYNPFSSMQRKQEGEPSRHFVSQQKESFSFRGVVPTQAREASRVFFTAPSKEGARRESTTIWGLLCDVTGGLQREVQQVPGATFSLSKQESSNTVYSDMRSLSQAASHMKISNDSLNYMDKFQGISLFRSENLLCIAYMRQ